MTLTQKTKFIFYFSVYTDQQSVKPHPRIKNGLSTTGHAFDNKKSASGVNDEKMIENIGRQVAKINQTVI
jgi:hypothetical protein